MKSCATGKYLVEWATYNGAIEIGVTPEYTWETKVAP